MPTLEELEDKLAQSQNQHLMTTFRAWKVILEQTDGVLDELFFLKIEKHGNIGADTMEEINAEALSRFGIDLRQIVLEKWVEM